MQFLIGDGRSKTTLNIIKKHKWGRMLNVGLVTPYKDEPLGFDNHAWADYCNKQPFNEKKFLTRIKKAEHLAPHFIVCVTPDRVKGGNESLAFSNSWINRLADNGWPWFLAVQDGMTPKLVEDSLTKYPYSGVFLGGGDSFKIYEAKRYAYLAKKYGLKFHYGRCGTKRKIRRAYEVGADSCDSVIFINDADRVSGVARELNFQVSLRKEHAPLCVASYDDKKSKEF